jgi:hypothetical protein
VNDSFEEENASVISFLAEFVQVNERPVLVVTAMPFLAVIGRCYPLVLVKVTVFLEAKVRLVYEEGKQPRFLVARGMPCVVAGIAQEICHGDVAVIPFYLSIAI